MRNGATIGVYEVCRAGLSFILYSFYFAVTIMNVFSDFTCKEKDSVDNIVDSFKRIQPLPRWQTICMISYFKHEQ